MRALSYNDGRDILRQEGDGGHISLINIPKNSDGMYAMSISDGSVLVLVRTSPQSYFGGRMMYEWYARGEL